MFSSITISCYFLRTMVNNRKRKTNRQSWTVQAMTNALSAVDNNEMGYLMAATVYGVPKTTLIRRAKKQNKRGNGAVKVLGRESYLPKELEDELYDYIIKMEEMLYGLTSDDLREMVYKLAERNKIKHPFSLDTKKAGWSWMAGFWKRYPTLSIRTPENTSVARARGFNEAAVSSFFRIWKDLQEEYDFGPHRIFNVDEKGVSTVPNHPPKIIALKGRKQVGGIASAEKGETTTLVMCGSASGFFVPPLFIFPRVRNNNDLMIDAPPGAIMDNFSTGWIQGYIFVNWLKHFISQTNTSKDNPCALILDGHSTHTKSIELIDLARENGVHIVCLPPHTTHRLQPLDVSIMKPLSTNLANQSRLFMRNNPGATIGLYQVAGIFKRASENACTQSNMMSGFEKCGIYPLDEDRFQNMYRAASVTDVPAPEDSITSSTSQDRENPHDHTETVPEAVATSSTPQDTGSLADHVEAAPNSPTSLETGNLQPETSHESNNQVTISSTPQTSSISEVSNSATHVSPQDILPYPKANIAHEQAKRKTKKRKTGKAALITSSPYKLDLTKDEEIKALKEEIKAFKSQMKELKRKTTETSQKSKMKPKKINRRKLAFQDTPTTSDDKPSTSAVQAVVTQSSNVCKYEKGEFVLVRFVVRDTEQYYAGFITKKTSSHNVEIKFLRKKAVKKPSLERIGFYYPEQDDFKTVDINTIVLKLKKSTVQVVGKSLRVAGMIFIDEPRFKDFQPIY